MKIEDEEKKSWVINNIVTQALWNATIFTNNPPYLHLSTAQNLFANDFEN